RTSALRREHRHRRVASAGSFLSGGQSERAIRRLREVVEARQYSRPMALTLRASENRKTIIRAAVREGEHHTQATNTHRRVADTSAVVSYRVFFGMRETV